MTAVLLHNQPTYSKLDFHQFGSSVCVFVHMCVFPAGSGTGALTSRRAISQNAPAAPAAESEKLGRPLIGIRAAAAAAAAASGGRPLSFAAAVCSAHFAMADNSRAANLNLTLG